MALTRQGAIVFYRDCNHLLANVRRHFHANARRFEGNTKSPTSRRVASTKTRHKSAAAAAPLCSHRVTTSASSSTHWHQQQLGPMSPRDRRFALPGNCGTAESLVANDEPPMGNPEQVFTLGELGMEDKITRCFDTFMQLNVASVPSDSKRNEESMVVDMLPPSGYELECKVQQCPTLLTLDVSELFPGMTSERTTVITLAHHTKLDQKVWSEAMESERTLLYATFRSTATELCSRLHEAGHWADFVDPESGKPHFLQPSTTAATLTETSDAYRHLGFRVTDYGCCKCIEHDTWASNVFVGSIFTSAHIDSVAVQVISDTINSAASSAQSSSTAEGT